MSLDRVQQVELEMRRKKNFTKQTYVHLPDEHNGSG